MEAHNSGELGKMEMSDVLTEKRYRYRQVRFEGRDVFVFLQTPENADTCPLVALANVLLLRGHRFGAIFVDGRPPALPWIAEEVLLLQLQDVISRVDARTSDPGVLANWRQNQDDALEVLGSLASGMNLNVGFHRVDKVEATRELVPFDLLGVRVLHAFIAPPENTDLQALLGSRNFNAAKDLQIRLLEDRDRVLQQARAAGAARANARVDDELQRAAEQRQWNAADSAEAAALALDVILTAEDDVGREVREDEEAVLASEVMRSLGRSVRSPRGGDVAVHVAQPVRSTAPGEVLSDAERRELDEADRKLAQLTTFLDSPAQSTPAGFAALRRGLHEGELAVLYRRAHYSTILWQNGTLLELCTVWEPGAVGPSVWRALDEQGGVAAMMDDRFKPVVERGAQTCTAGDEALALQLQRELDMEAAVAARPRAHAGPHQPSNG